MTRTLAASTLRTAALLSLATSFVPAAWAQAAPVGAVAYAPLAGAQAVPTLSQWGMAALALVLAALASRLLRGQGGVLRLAALGLLAGAALLASPWSGQALARPADDVLLDNPAGGTAPLPDHPDFERPFADYMHGYTVRNTTGRPQRIKAVTVTAAHRIMNSHDDTQCTVGQILAPAASCSVVVGRPH